MSTATNSFTRRAVWFVLLATISACQDADPDTRRADVDVLPADRVTCATDSLAVSNSEANFSMIRSIAVDSRGRMYVNDVLAPYITVLAPDGSVLRKIGNSGSGPGEFQRVGSVQVIRGDSILVFDPKLNRVTVFPPNSAEPAYTINLATASSLGAPERVVRVPGSSRMLAAYTRAFTPHGDPSKDDQRTKVLRLLAADGSPLRDSVLVVPARQMLVNRSGGGVTVAPNPFGSTSLFRVGPEGRIFYSWTDTLGIAIYSLQGELLGGFSAEYRPPRVTDEDIRSAEKLFGSELPPHLREQLPARWPAVKNFMVDDRGRVWVGLSTSATEPAEWAVFTDAGDYLCSVMLPPTQAVTTIPALNAGVRAVHNGRIYAVSVDPQTRVPRVIVYDVEISAEIDDSQQPRDPET